MRLRGYPAVVLSGSHAAVGHASHDFAIGLRRTLLAAGARSVLAAAWDVADEPAALLASAFYRAMARAGADADGPRVSQAAALRAAVQAVRKADGGRWDHPAFWAGYSVIGGGARSV